MLNHTGCVQLLLSQWSSSFHLSLTFKTCLLHLHPSPLPQLYLAQRVESQSEAARLEKAKRGRGGENSGLFLLLSGLYYYLLEASSMKDLPVCLCVSASAGV